MKGSECMKKLLITITVILLIVFIAIAFLVSKIEVDITENDLPQDVYMNAGDPAVLAQEKLIEIFNPFSTEDDYTLFEEFLNYMLLDSIRDNVNDEYDPLDDTCTEITCDVIVETDYGNVEYAFVELNSDNQVVVTVNFNRENYPVVETAIFAVFDVEFNIIELEINLILDTLHINDIEITKENLDYVLSQFNPTEIENMISSGELDLETYTYTVSLIE